MVSTDTIRDLNQFVVFKKIKNQDEGNWQWDSKEKRLMPVNEA